MGWKNIFSKGVSGLLGAKANYDAARHRRRTANWQPSHNSARALIFSDGNLMRARCRDIVRNNSYASGACASFQANLVGCGVKPSSLIEDPKLRDEVMKLWLQWTMEADADGQNDFYGLQPIIARALFEAGECFVRFRVRRRGDMDTVPLQLQLLESDMLDFSYTLQLANGNSIINGIELDQIGRRVAYHFWPYHPGDFGLPFDVRQPLRVRVPASEVIHIFRSERPGQLRGVPIVAPSVIRLWQLDQYDDAELDRKKIAAMYAGFITSPEAEDVLDAEDDAGTVTLEPGTMQALLPGEDIKFSSPAEVGGSFEAFQYRTLLAACAGMNVPYYATTGDMRKANYSSLRGAIVEYRRRLEQIQENVIIQQFLRPVWQRWMREAVLAGELKMPGFATKPRMYNAARFIPPAYEWVDPLKDLAAEQMAVEAGFKSRSDVVEAQGYDAEETDRRIAADHAREKELGLVFSSNASLPADIANLTIATAGDAADGDQADGEEDAA